MFGQNPCHAGNSQPTSLVLQRDPRLRATAADQQRWDRLIGNDAMQDSGVTPYRRVVSRYTGPITTLLGQTPIDVGVSGLFVLASLYLTTEESVRARLPSLAEVAGRRASHWC